LDRLERNRGDPPGKDADLALWDGDPFEWTTHCTNVVIDGNVIASEDAWGN